LLFGPFGPHIAWLSKQATVGFSPVPRLAPCGNFTLQEFLMLIAKISRLRGTATGLCVIVADGLCSTFRAVAGVLVAHQRKVIGTLPNIRVQA